MSQQTATSQVTLFMSNISPPSRFVRMVLEQLNIDYNLKEVNFFSGEHKTSEFEAINPAKALPAIKDGDFCLAESRAIASYLCNKYAPDSDLYPKDLQTRARVEQILYSDMSFIGVVYKFAKIEEVFMHNQKPDYSDDSKVHAAFALYEHFLSKHKYLAADHLTLADLTCINSVVVLDLIKYNNYEKFPNLKRWIDEMKKLPYYEKCTGIPNQTATDMVQEKLNA